MMNLKWSVLGACYTFPITQNSLFNVFPLLLLLLFLLGSKSLKNTERRV